MELFSKKAPCMKRNILFLVLSFVIVILIDRSQKQISYEYPEIIKKYKLEELHDLAKWEVYKSNSIRAGNDFVVNFDSFSMLKVFYRSYNKMNREEKKSYPLRMELEKLVGRENVKDYMELDIVLFQKDSSDIFDGEEIELSFFPTRAQGKYWRKMFGGNCYNVIFKNGKIERKGCDDYVEFDYDRELQEKSEKAFMRILEDSPSINPWLVREQNKRKKNKQPDDGNRKLFFLPLNF